MTFADWHWLFRKHVEANRELLREGAEVGGYGVLQKRMSCRARTGPAPGRSTRCCCRSRRSRASGITPSSEAAWSQTLASDIRQLGAVEEGIGSRVAVVGASRRGRGKPLGSDTMRPRSLVLYGDPSRELGGEYTGLEYEEDVYAEVPRLDRARGGGAAGVRCEAERADSTAHHRGLPGHLAGGFPRVATTGLAYRRKTSGSHCSGLAGGWGPYLEQEL